MALDLSPIKPKPSRDHRQRLAVHLRRWNRSRFAGFDADPHRSTGNYLWFIADVHVIISSLFCYISIQRICDKNATTKSNNERRTIHLILDVVWSCFGRIVDGWPGNVKLSTILLKEKTKCRAISRSLWPALLSFSFLSVWLSVCLSPRLIFLLPLISNSWFDVDCNTFSDGLHLNLNSIAIRFLPICPAPFNLIC